MHWTLAFRPLVVRPGRSLVLLVGYGIGVGVMIVLLSVGDAMLLQSRDVSLVGGGELTVLPEGIDVEALRTGAMTGMYFGIDRARFVTRQLLGGPRHATLVRAVSPSLESKRLMLTVRDTTYLVRAGGDLPTVAGSVGVGLDVTRGSWGDPAIDAQWDSPAPQALYDELDRFHQPVLGDSTWGEWHYFNVLISDTEWWYVTLLVGGDLSSDRWGGQFLATHRTNAGHRRFVENVPRTAVTFDTTAADLVVGNASVVQRDGTYHVRARAGRATLDFELTPRPRGYFPPVELRDDRVMAGYVVPGLVARARGRFCDGDSCRDIVDAPAYHDHNWGSWRDVTWEWGTGRGRHHALLYGGVVVGSGASSAGSAPYFLTVVDSMGVRQVYRFRNVDVIDRQPVRDAPGALAPRIFTVTATRLADTLRLAVVIDDVHATRSAAGGFARTFLQMRGTWTATGTAAGVPLADSGSGFFETWLQDRGP